MSATPEAFAKPAPADRSTIFVSAREDAARPKLSSASLSKLELIARGIQIMALTLAYLVPAASVAAVLMVLGKRKPAADRLARHAVALLQRLGPTFVKAGQILGTRRDEIPHALCDRLSALQDSVAPMSRTLARQALTDIYGQELSSVFAEIDYEPVASGSVASVYRGRLADGRDVAIKLQRPGIARVMAKDLALISRLGAAAARLPIFRGVPVRTILDHLCGAVEAQLDFAREAECLVRLRDNLAAVPRVWVPRFYAEASRERALVMEFVPGLETAAAERAPPAMRKRLAVGALSAVYHMLFVDGFVHCDLHPGNLYFKESGQVVILDAGFAVQLTERMRRLFAEFFLEMSLGRGWRCADIVIESAAERRADADLPGFRRHMADLVHRNHGLTAGDFSLIAFASEMFDLQRRYGLYAATELVFPLLSLLVVEGTVRDLNPEVDFQETAKPILVRGAFGAVS